VTIAGCVDVLVTMRGHDDAAVLARLETILQRYPVAQPPPAPTQAHGEGWCVKHHVQMKWNPAKDGGKGWHSHKAADGWCKGK
jgi:hypothetical protein